MKDSVRSERMSNVIYLLATVIIILGFIAQLSSQPVSGLVLIVVGFSFITAVSVHGYVLGLAGTKFQMDLSVCTLQVSGLLCSCLSIISIAIAIQANSVLIWLGIVGSLLMFIGGSLNLVFKMQQTQADFLIGKM